jgi:hypothetical protein
MKNTPFRIRAAKINQNQAIFHASYSIRPPMKTIFATLSFLLLTFCSIHAQFVTNTATTNFDMVTGMDALHFATDGIQVYPNPSRGSDLHRMSCREK